LNKFFYRKIAAASGDSALRKYRRMPYSMGRATAIFPPRGRF